MLKIQFKILEYIEKNVKNSYIGDYVNQRGVRHLFSVKNHKGQRHVMAIAISQELDQQDDRFSRRPFRAIITVFFMAENDVERSQNFVKNSRSGTFQNLKFLNFF